MTTASEITINTKSRTVRYRKRKHWTKTLMLVATLLWPTAFIALMVFGAYMDSEKLMREQVTTPGGRHLMLGDDYRGMWLITTSMVMSTFCTAIYASTMAFLGVIYFCSRPG